MHILLPPSETKRDGGQPLPLDLSGLSFSRLNPERRRVIRALSALARDDSASLKALKLGPKGAPEVARNRMLKQAPTLPALERYTGVLYDALNAAELNPADRARAGERVVIHSALFGLLGADDLIPAYRLSHDSRLPELSLRRLWSVKLARELAAIPGLILDLRSESYVALGRAPLGERSAYLRVVTRGEGGQVRALNHFNKHAKGEFARSLLSLETAPQTLPDLIEAARSLGWALALAPAAEPDRPTELMLTIEAPAAPAGI